jgi:hypothetical protein
MSGFEGECSERLIREEGGVDDFGRGGIGACCDDVVRGVEDTALSFAD